MGRPDDRKLYKRPTREGKDGVSRIEGSRSKKVPNVTKPHDMLIDEVQKVIKTNFKDEIFSLFTTITLQFN